MKFIKLKYSEYYLVASVVATVEIMSQMKEDGVPLEEVQSYLTNRVSELITQFKQNKDLYKEKVALIKGNSEFMELIKKIQSQPMDVFVRDVVKFINDGVLAVVVGGINPQTGGLEQTSFGDYLIMHTEEYALAMYKSVIEIQNSKKIYDDSEFQARFHQSTQKYTEIYRVDRNLFLKEFSEIVPEEKIQDFSKFLTELLSMAIGEAEKLNNVRNFVLGGLENKFLRFEKLGAQ